MADSDVTAAQVRELLRYDPVTGCFFWKASRKSGTAVAGAIAGYQTDRGYITIMIHRRQHRAHRLAWLHVHGEWPDGEIDHINRVRHDNRIANLRVVSKSTNQRNRADPQRNNKVGLLGVQRRKNKFAARIQVSGKTKFLGLFDSPGEARAAYVNAKRILHPDA